MKKASCMAFLAGCFPIALIEILHVFIFDSDEAVFIVQCFAVLYMAVSIWACIDTGLFFRRQFQSVRIPCKISGLQRKDLFSSGAISYYVIPFISFIGCSRRVKFAKLRRSKNANSGRVKFANLSQSKRANHKISTAQIGCSGYG